MRSTSEVGRVGRVGRVQGGLRFLQVPMIAAKPNGWEGWEGSRLISAYVHMRVRVRVHACACRVVLFSNPPNPPKSVSSGCFAGSFNPPKPSQQPSQPSQPSQLWSPTNDSRLPKGAHVRPSARSVAQEQPAPGRVLSGVPVSDAGGAKSCAWCTYRRRKSDQRGEWCTVREPHRKLSEDQRPTCREFVSW